MAGGLGAPSSSRDSTGPPLPTETRMVRLRARLFDPSRGAVMAVGRPYQVEVREASQTAELDIPAGASQVAFNPIPVRLKFTSNETAGRATAEEFQGQFTSGAGSESVGETGRLFMGLGTSHRYWAVYDTLKRGTFAATVTFTYDPALDFPAASEFNEDSLVVAGLNPMSGDRSRWHQHWTNRPALSRPNTRSSSIRM